MGVASLVLGIIAIILGACGLGIFGGVLGIIGIVLGVMGRKVPEKRGIATGGLVCSIIGTILSLAFYIACAGCLAAVGSSL